jgi:hypothetical protein
MDDDEDFHKSLDYIQNIIDRQASNSFKIKGWAVTLVVVALLFRSNKYQFLSAFVPLVGFWYLDAYYLRQERMFRKLYSWMVEEQPETRVEKFTMDQDQFDDDVDNILSLMTSDTLAWFYGIIALLLVLYGALITCTGGSF